MRTTALACSILALMTSCAYSDDYDQQHFARPWLDSPRLEEWRVLDLKKAEYAPRSKEPQMQEFEGCGTMFVWNHSLDGGAGWEYLRAAYTYKNTTDEKLDWVRVWCEVLDPAGRVVNRGEDVLMHPLGYAFTKGDTWSDEIKVPTRGIHLRDGWSWRIGCRPIRMKVLPPVRTGG
jgi:hypothetical protein